MTKNILRWSLIAILILIAPLICIEVLSYFTINVESSVVNSFQAKSKIAFVIIIITNLISAIITALITAFPSGYLAGKQARIIAILFIVSIECFPVYTFFQMPPFKAFSMSVLLGQFIAVGFSVFIFTEMGSRLAAKKQDKAAV
ncbi:hypothetical protein FO488_06160 [Geobacter sp. FeAm09]|uniref:hypothetical protein n=1 Tax=Geobacter sp. FeAm09 TaxID=2597769 RepID=UPI0011F0680C|nr:hypothetical protein [Geobacter sp. FeAm09]QEM67780.1 hypothetical protein FO488_06160 [Geobacter sp. FeAm09]